MNKKAFLFAGEQSGDQILAHLTRLLSDQGWFCFGVGGQKSADQGLKVVQSMDQFQVMGFVSVIKNIFFILKNFIRLKNLILKEQPDLVLFVDYPGLSLKMAKALRRGGFKNKICQYVCPSIWAWKKNRKKILERDFDLLFTLFSFEEALFSQSSLKAIFCGHPTLFQNLPSTDEPQFDLILYPGSRLSIIKTHLPILLDTAHVLKQQNPEMTIAISCARPSLIDCIQKINLSRYPLELNRNKKGEKAIAVSGTITLELALQEVPTLVIYQVNRFDAFIAQKLFRLSLPSYCIVNILLNSSIFPEKIGVRLDPKELATIFKKNLPDSIPLDTLKNKMHNPDHDAIFIREINSLFCL